MAPADPAAEGERRKHTVPPLLDRLAGLSWRFVVIVVAAAIIVVGLVQLRVVVLPIIVAAFLATLLKPVADRLRSFRFRPALAAAVTLASALLVLGGVMTFIVFEVADQTDSIAADASRAIDEIENWLVDGPVSLNREQIADARNRIARSLRDNSDVLTQGAVRAGTVAVEAVAGGLLAIVLLFFILKDGHRAGDAVAGILGEERAGDLRALGVKVWNTMAGYLRGVAVTGIVDASIIGIGLALLGVPLVVPLMLLTFMGAFIPLIGATVAGILAALVALASNGPGTALAVGALVLVVQQVEGDLLAPLVLGRAVRLHAVSILLAITAGSVVAGIIGAFLAVPVAALTKTVIEHYRTSLPVLPAGSSEPTT